MCHRWFTRGQRSPGLCDQRCTWAHLFAAVYPHTGQEFAPVLPGVSTRSMQVFLDRFAATLAPDEHTVMVLDQAGWHGARALAVPGNVTLMPLPPYAPQLNPVERVWLYLPNATSATACSQATAPSWTPAAPPGTSLPRNACDR